VPLFNFQVFFCWQATLSGGPDFKNLGKWVELLFVKARWRPLQNLFVKRLASGMAAGGLIIIFMTSLA
jgi:hypothetical protein